MLDIAKEIRVDKSTISREIKRNRFKNGCYTLSEHQK
ncbi:helix-turn-helix domain-containing protein [Thorsellia anophelis]